MIPLTARLLHVFHWPVAHPIRLLLPGMVLLSLLLHILVAYAVKVAPPSRPGLAPWPSKITILPTAEKRGATLLEASDPSWLEPGRYRDRILPPPEVVRKKTSLYPGMPPLLPVPRGTVAETWVPSLPPVAACPLFIARAPQPPPPEFVPAGARFESGAAWITKEVATRLRAVAPPQSPGRATDLLVVLAPTGDVRHVWLVRGSGDAELDLAAQLAVQRSRFAPADGVRRDVLRIFWGPREEAP